MKFYMGYGARDRPKQLVPYIEEESIPILTTAVERWSDNTNSFKKMWKYETDRIIDSGGYTVLSSYGEYPWNVSQYHKWLSNNSDWFNEVFVMDYPFSYHNKEGHEMPIEKRRKKTIENTIEHESKPRDYDIVPVVQGRNPEEFLDFALELESKGVDMSRFGVGSVADIKNIDNIENIISKIRSNFPKSNIHGFGMSISSINESIDVDTMDSYVWLNPVKRKETYYMHNGKLKTMECSKDTMGDVSKASQYRTVGSFKAYHKYVKQKIEENYD